MKAPTTKPPRFAERLLSWICKDDLVDEILGDLHQYYVECADLPQWKRLVFYWFHASNFLRPFALKRLGGEYRLNHYGMFKNYFKTTIRSLRKSPLTSFINVFGLAVAIGVCMVVYAFLDFDASLDRYHENKDKVYMTTYFVDREGKEEQYGKTPAPLGELMRADFPSIEKVCQIHDQNVVLKYGDNVFHESVRFTDPEYLEMFTHPLESGSMSSLQDVNSIILTRTMATKYFGYEDPMGKEVIMIFGDGSKKTFKVSGVTQQLPKRRMITFGFLVNFQNLKTLDPSFDSHDWKNMISGTFIQVDNSRDVEQLRSEMEAYKELQNAVDPDWAITKFNFIVLKDLHLRGKEYRQAISGDFSEEGRVGLPVIGLFILLLACFNYINIAIVSAAKRLKEIGLRKVVGANRALVITQFLAENILITLFAGIIGFFLAASVFLPWFSTFSGIATEFDLMNPDIWLFLGAVLLFTGLVSGIYPAFYISKFQVVSIFKGTVKFGKKNVLTKAFLTVQLMIACVGIAFAVMFAQNSWYQAQRSWGYDQRNTLYVEVPDFSGFEKMREEITADASVLSVSGSVHHLGRRGQTIVAKLPEREYEVREVAVDADYFSTMGLELEVGRDFQKGSEADQRSVIISKHFADVLELEDPIEKQIKIDSVAYTIVGVTKEFRFNNFYYELRPTIFTLAEEEEYKFLTMRVQDGSQYENHKRLQTAWATHFPEIPFQGGYQEDVWPGFYDDLETMKRFTRAVAMVFILLASLGLYGLVRLNIVGRIREFSIRKALGAGTQNLAKNVFNQYVLIALLAIVFGVPLGHVMNTAMIDMMFPEPRPFGYTGAIISAVILVFVLILVIATQVRNVVKADPVEGLKVE